MKKIAHVLVLPKMAGSQKFCHMLLSKLQGYEKYVIVSKCEDVNESQVEEFTKAFLSIDVKIIWCSNLRRNIGKDDLKGFIELYKIFKLHKFDIVHTNSTKPGILARIAARLSGIKRIVHTVHGISFYRNQSAVKRFIYWAIEILALQFGDVNVCVNEFYLKYYKHIFWKKTITIHNGYDFSILDRFKKNNERFLFQRKDKFSFLFVGRLDNQKDPLTLIKAFSILVKRHPNLSLDIVGDGELRSLCEELVSTLNIDKYVKFHGWIDSPFKYFMECDAFVCPSTYEAFGFIFLEAAYFAKPIVSTNVEGIPEVVVDNKMGFLVDPNDYSEFAKKMEILALSPKIAAEMGTFGSKYVTEKFNENIFINSYESLYEKLLKNKR